jgi:predicted nucleic-acid-binding protein
VKGLDTNVRLRLLLRDDPIQAVAAGGFVEAACTAETPCLINRINRAHGCGETATVDKAAATRLAPAGSFPPIETSAKVGRV